MFLYRIETMRTDTAFAFDVAAAFVLCGLKIVMSSHEYFITNRIHLEIVTLETGLNGFTT